jgi:4-hydroxyproline epimerase
MTSGKARQIRVIDSHTGGEPTRLVVSGAPDLGSGPLNERLERFRTQHDDFRSAVVNEPRGSDVIVGALLCEPVDRACAAGVIFFNNVGYLGMCGHGTIGLVASLAHAGRIDRGPLRIDTPVGPVDAVLNDDGSVEVANVPSYRQTRALSVEVPGHGRVTGDVAWGGNWFFLVSDHGQKLDVERVDILTDCAWRIRQALESNGVTGRDGQEIDHIELFGPPSLPGADSRNFVLCPGKAYDRSPCGTGTSAKLACLAADGKLKPGETWRQESIIGSLFEGSYRAAGDCILPAIKGAAYITAEATLLLDPRDPFRMGIRS